MKIDMHCHSSFSKRPTLWIMQKLGCPESFTEPEYLYKAARLRGMDAVTITDHNMIDGALAIAHLPNTFVSCEYTAYFPEDRCKVHVLVYDISQEQHQVLLEARQNIFEMCAFLNENEIAHACAHPLYGPNDRLTVAHIEKMFLLFKVWEWNGDLAPEVNEAMREITEKMTEEELYALELKHGIKAYGKEPWRKCIISGSDDHSSLNLASTYTEVRGATDFASFWDGIQKMQARIHPQDNTPKALARGMYSIVYQYYRNRFNLARYLHQDTFLLFIDRMLQHGHTHEDSRLSRFQRYFFNRRKARQSTEKMTLFQLSRHEAWNLIQESPNFLGIAEKGLPQGADPNEIWADFVTTLGNKLLMHMGNSLVERLTNARLFDLFHSLGSAAALYSVLSPYFVSYSHFVRQRDQARELLCQLKGQSEERYINKKRVAHFTDTFFEVNGVARTLQQHLVAARELKKDYLVITCSTYNGGFVEGLQLFEPVGTWSLPEYSELDLYVPPFLQLLQYCYEEGFTHIHASTPGPMGLAALGIARILKLSISGTYHTAMPQYGKILTEDSYVEELLWKGMISFYEQLDYVYAPSKATAQELIDNGLTPGKIRVYPRGVNTDRFHPGKKNLDELNKYGADKDKTTLLYVGRVSKEKGLDVLMEAFCLLVEEKIPVQLLIVGDGPYRKEMDNRLAGYPAVFTGYIEGEALPEIYASSDIFVFPSATDTFGNVVLEAQACGVPVIVCDQGGPMENMLPGETGSIFPAGDIKELANAIRKMIDDESFRRQCGAAGRDYVAKRSFLNAFGLLYEMYVQDERERDNKEPDISSLYKIGRLISAGVA